MKKLRLLITAICDRNCPGCCNKDWDLKGLDNVNNNFHNYDEILLTGGEPLLTTEILINTITKIKEQNPTARIFIYTANYNPIKHEYLLFIHDVDGITVTIHEQKDVQDFVKLDEHLSKIEGINRKSLRLNIFSGISIPNLKCNWWLKQNMEWIENCPLPVNEVFMKI